MSVLATFHFILIFTFKVKLCIPILWIMYTSLDGSFYVIHLKHIYPLYFHKWSILIIVNRSSPIHYSDFSFFWFHIKCDNLAVIVLIFIFLLYLNFAIIIWYVKQLILFFVFISITFIFIWMILFPCTNISINTILRIFFYFPIFLYKRPFFVLPKFRSLLH